MTDVTIDKDIETILDYRFTNRELLKQALTTKAYSNEHRGKDQNEFSTIGDAVLKLVLTEMLMEKGHKTGGTITPERVKQEREEAFADIARKLKIRPYMKLGKRQEEQNHGDNNHVLAETLEAIAGAMYYDKVFDETKSVMKKWFKL